MKTLLPGVQADAVGDWLDAPDLGQYREAFARASIDIPALAELTQTDLREFGVAMGHRKRFLSCAA